MKIEGSGSASGSINQTHGSPDPDSHQNVMDPQHREIGYVMNKYHLFFLTIVQYSTICSKLLFFLTIVQYSVFKTALVPLFFSLGKGYVLVSGVT
jgi:hypothetical protein